MQVGPESPVFRIGVAKELTGLSERQIRYYDRVGLVSPKRTEGGTRMYSENDIAMLKRIKEMMQWGFRVKEVKEKLEEERLKAEGRGGRGGHIGKRAENGAGFLATEDERPVVLRSLYPVSNQAALSRTLDKIRKD